MTSIVIVGQSSARGSRYSSMNCLPKTGPAASSRPATASHVVAHTTCSLSGRAARHSSAKASRRSCAPTRRRSGWSANSSASVVMAFELRRFQARLELLITPLRRIPARARQQLAMGTGLDDLAVLEPDELVGIGHRGQPRDEDDRRPPLTRLV